MSETINKGYRHRTHLVSGKQKGCTICGLCTICWLLQLLGPCEFKLNYNGHRTIQHTWRFLATLHAFFPPSSYIRQGNVHSLIHAWPSLHSWWLFQRVHMSAAPRLHWCENITDTSLSSAAIILGSPVPDVTVSLYGVILLVSKCLYRTSTKATILLVPSTLQCHISRGVESGN